MSTIRGIKGVEGRTPIGATLSISRRLKPRGVPSEKEGFHILNAREDNGLKLQHPRFHQFNSAPFEHRQVVQGNLVHAEEIQCFEWHRKAQQIHGLKMHPHKRPACVGNGVTAVRWSGNEPDEFMEIQCLNSKCEFAQGEPPPCKPWLRFVFLFNGQHTWPKHALPNILIEFTSGSWHTLQNFVGFFDYVRDTARNLGIDNYSLTGYPISLQHTYQTQPEKRRRFQVVRITPMVEPVEFFYQQAEQIKKIQQDYGTFEALPDQTQQDPNVVFEQHRDISVDWGKK